MPYAYAGDDPVNESDPSGLYVDDSTVQSIKEALETVAGSGGAVVAEATVTTAAATIVAAGGVVVLAGLDLYLAFDGGPAPLIPGVTTPAETSTPTATPTISPTTQPCQPSPPTGTTTTSTPPRQASMNFQTQWNGGRISPRPKVTVVAPWQPGVTKVQALSGLATAVAITDQRIQTVPSFQRANLNAQQFIANSVGPPANWSTSFNWQAPNLSLLKGATGTRIDVESFGPYNLTTYG